MDDKAKAEQKLLLTITINLYQKYRNNRQSSVYHVLYKPLWMSKFRASDKTAM